MHENATIIDTFILNVLNHGKYKTLLQRWLASSLELVVGSDVVERIDRSTYFGSIITTDGLLSEEISAQIQKVRLDFTSLCHLCRRDTPPPTKRRVCCPEVLFILLYECETCSLRIEDIHALLVFDHKCLRSIVCVFSDNGVSNAWIKNRVLGYDEKSIDEVVNLQLR